MGKNKIVAVYIRVSTEGQRDDGYSIDAQKALLSAYCISKELPDFEYYIDGGFTGSNIDRPALTRLISDVKAEAVSHVIVYKLDRLSRSQKDTLYLIEDVFNPKGVTFVSMNENMDTSTPIGRAMLGIMSAFAQLERETIRERTRMGMLERVKSGLWPGGGRIPFGYDYDKEKGILVPNADAETVRRAYDLYLAGYSTDRIAQLLGLRYERLAHQILTRKSNAGYIVYNGVEYKGQHEAIISEELYARTMEYMRQRAKMPLTTGDYLLTGLLVCGKCGAKMRYQKWGKTDCKIVCYSADKSKRHLVHDANCENKRHSAWEIEDIVKNDLFALSVRQKTAAETGEKQQSLRDILTAREAAVRTKITRLYNLYGDTGDDMLRQAIEVQKAALRQVQAELARADADEKQSTQAMETKKSLENLAETWPFLSFSERKSIVRSCVEKIIITDDTVDIFYRFAQ